MTDLQCAATLLVAPSEAAAALAPRLRARSVAHVWTSPQVRAARAATEVATALGVGVSERVELADPSQLDAMLAELADQHRGETALVVVDGTGEVVETSIDGDGRIDRPWRPARVFSDRFRGPALDPSVWLPHYLPAWSSRAQTAAAYRLDEDGLVLRIPRNHPLWCPEDHLPPLRVSGIQSGSWSGPVGSPRGQQRFRPDLTVREEQPRFEGWLPSSGRVAVTARMVLSERSMAALWLSGFEDDPEQLRCGEICVVEVFGRDLGPASDPSAEVGVGIKPFRDPELTDDFAAPRLPIDVREPHTYAVDWDAEEAVFTVDGEVARRCARPPTYPMQLMLAVFDFPEWSTGDDDHLVPELVVREISGYG